MHIRTDSCRSRELAYVRHSPPGASHKSPTAIRSTPRKPPTPRVHALRGLSFTAGSLTGCRRHQTTSPGTAYISATYGAVTVSGPPGYPGSKIVIGSPPTGTVKLSINTASFVPKFTAVMGVLGDM